MQYTAGESRKCNAQERWSSKRSRCRRNPVVNAPERRAGAHCCIRRLCETHAQSKPSKARLPSRADAMQGRESQRNLSCCLGSPVGSARLIVKLEKENAVREAAGHRSMAGMSCGREPLRLYHQLFGPLGPLGLP